MYLAAAILFNFVASHTCTEEIFEQLFLTAETLRRREKIFWLDRNGQTLFITLRLRVFAVTVPYLSCSIFLKMLPCE